MVGRRKSTYKIKLMFVFWTAALWMFVMPLAAGAESIVFDEAELFSSEEKTELEELGQKLEKEYKMNFLMLTIDDAHGMSSAQFAEEFYEKEGYDTNGRSGGIVLIIDMDNRQMNLITTGSMIYYITDAREERIYDAGEDYVREKEYADAMYAMLRQVQTYMEKGIPDNQYTYDTETGKIVYHRSLTSMDVLMAFAAAFLCAGGACFVLYRKYSVVKEYEYQINQNAEINLTGREDRLVRQFVTQRKIPRNPPPDSGGIGGGGRTSTHTSSGGRTYGGGHGRGF
ncbi:MAG: TPM domain-containing protein [Eubacteriales bacterium]|nr:TPM domain-containing protein [Eubacteriales bacterium]